MDRLCRPITWGAWLAAVCAAFVSLPAKAIDCPVDRNGDVVPSWPQATKSPPVSGNWTYGGGSTCGGSTAGVATPTSPGSFASLQTQLDARYEGSTALAPYLYGASTGTRITYCLRYDLATGGRRGFEIYTDTTPVACDPPAPPPPPYDCTSYQGLTFSQTIAGVGPPPELACVDAGLPGESCIATQVGTSICAPDDLVVGCWARYEITGGACTKPPEAPQAWADDSEKCIPLAGGKSFCANNVTAEASCGWVNDEYVCLNKIYEDGCKVLSDGSRLCGGEAPAPPKPDNGTPGVPAEPDASVDVYPEGASAGGGASRDFFTPETSGGSSRDPGDGSNPASSTTNPSGGGTSADSGTAEADKGQEDAQYASGTASGGVTCDAPPTCTHGDPVQCAILIQQWRTRCESPGNDWESPTEVELLDGIGATAEERSGDLSGGVAPIDITSLNADGGFSAPSCPPPLSITVMGRVLSLDIWQAGCDMAVMFAPFVMMMGYLLAAGIVVKGVRT